jgi:GNAT superfamily N-acetyltransferase
MTQPVAVGGVPGEHGSPAPLPVTVRSWRAGDELLVAAAERQLSPRSLYTRFFTGGHLFPPHYVERLAEHVTVVALAGEAAIGWAEIARQRDPSYVGHLGVLVVDAWQGRRIGPLLVRAALDAARRRGLSVVHADVMETNRVARRALRRTFGDRIHVTHEGDVLHYVLPLVPALRHGAAEGRAT